jgi:hypothetical protein
MPDAESQPTGARSEPIRLRAAADALAAPFVCIHAPSEAGARMARGPLGIAVLHLVMAALVLLGLLVLPGLLVQAGEVPSHPSVVVFLNNHALQDAVSEVTIAWKAFAVSGRAGPLAALVAAFLVVGFAGSSALTLAQWPMIQAGGSRWAAVRGGFCAVAGSVWLVLAGLLAWDVLAVVLRELIMLVSGGGMLFDAYAFYPVLQVLSAMAGIALGLRWVGLAAMGTRSLQGTYETTLRCEQCGYDLRHLAESGRCTECGADLAISIEAGRARRPPPIETELSAWTVWSTTIAILRRPSTFYRALPMRTSEQAARRFAVCLYLAMGVGASVWLWAALLLISGGPTGSRAVVFPIAAGTGVALAAWGMHRGIAALAIGGAYLFKLFPEPQHARKLVLYEAAYVWSFCLFNGLMLTTFMLWDNWITQHLLGGRYPFHIPAEPLLVLTGNLLLVILGILRYRKIIPFVRFANF